MLKKLFHHPVAAVVAGGAILGLALFYGGNQPVLKQISLGLNGNVSPTAPAAMF